MDFYNRRYFMKKLARGLLLENYGRVFFLTALLFLCIIGINEAFEIYGSFLLDFIYGNSVILFQLSCDIFSFVIFCPVFGVYISIISTICGVDRFDSQSRCYIRVCRLSLLYAVIFLLPFLFLISSNTVILNALPYAEPILTAAICIAVFLVFFAAIIILGSYFLTAKYYLLGYSLRESMKISTRVMKNNRRDLLIDAISFLPLIFISFFTFGALFVFLTVPYTVIYFLVYSSYVFTSENTTRIQLDQPRKDNNNV